MTCNGLSGVVCAIDSKSELHRLLIAAALCGNCRIDCLFPLSEDISATLSCLEKMGASFSFYENGIYIEGPICPERSRKIKIDCKNSGSTLRFLLPIIAAFFEGAEIECGESLKKRPIIELMNCLEKEGARFSHGGYPLKIEKTLDITKKHTFEICGDISSQYISGLLFLLPFTESSQIAITTDIESKGYVDMTCEALQKFGVRAEYSSGIFSVHGKYTAGNTVYSPNGDFSNSLYFLCCAGENGVCVDGLSYPSNQPDSNAVDLLSKIGYDVTVSDHSIFVSRKNRPSAFLFDVSQCPDAAPILSLVASIADGKSVLSNTCRLKYKESDREDAICRMINSLGGKAYRKDGNIYIEGRERLCGGNVETFSDHRIAMTAYCAGLFCEKEVILSDTDCIKKSYPGFISDFSGLAGQKRS